MTQVLCVDGFLFLWQEGDQGQWQRQTLLRQFYAYGRYLLVGSPEAPITISVRLLLSASQPPASASTLNDTSTFCGK